MCSLRSTDVVKYLLPALIALSSCAAPAPGEGRVDIVLRNGTDRPMELRARAGLFSRGLLLAPGEVWRGWVPREFVGSELFVEVSDGWKRRE
jgi:hypothetical protein